MSYTPTNWQTGDTITAEKLNKLENGVAGGGGGGSDIFELKFTATQSGNAYSVTANKTYAELQAALQAGTIIIANLFIVDTTYNCATYSVSPNIVEFVFLNSFYYDSQLDVWDITFSADSISLDTAYFPLTPGE